jgi:hypothetical protein
MDGVSILAEPQPADPAPPLPGPQPKPPRDQRLDAFRGLGMLIIFMAHAPGNPWNNWIPARFGFSSATELFVFCSGLASAMAFGSTFAKRGWFFGTARTLFRAWQVYWAHLGLFLALAALAVAVRNLTGSTAYFEEHIAPIAADPATALLGLVTLRWLPGYLDILPMYLVVLALMPLVVALVRIDRRLAAAAVLGLWLGANLGGWALPAEPWSDREWFFNPFGWQLVFFTGFAFMARWLPVPPRSPWLMLLAGAVLLVSLPLSYYRIIDAVPAIRDWRAAWDILIQKTDFGILRYVHFLALAYLAWIAVGERGHRLLPPGGAGTLARLWRGTLAVVMTVGQQSLAVFVFSMFVAQLLGVVLDQFGRSVPTMVLVNAVGFAMLVGVAYLVAWIKSQPWRSGGAVPSDG